MASLQGGATFNGNLVVNGTDAGQFRLSAAVRACMGERARSRSLTPGSITPSFTSSAWPVLTQLGQRFRDGLRRHGLRGRNDFQQHRFELQRSAFSKTNVAATLVPSRHQRLHRRYRRHEPVVSLTFSGNISGNSDVVLGSNSTIGAGGAGILFLSGSNSYSPARR